MGMFTKKEPDKKVEYQRPDQVSSKKLPPLSDQTVIEIDGVVYVPIESSLLNENDTQFKQNKQSKTADSLGKFVPVGTQIAVSWTKQLIYPDNDHGYCEDLFELHEEESRLVLCKKDGGRTPVEGRIMCSVCLKYNKKLKLINSLLKWLGCNYRIYS